MFRHREDNIQETQQVYIKHKSSSVVFVDVRKLEGRNILKKKTQTYKL
jgi:hypothetical protein